MRNNLAYFAILCLAACAAGIQLATGRALVACVLVVLAALLAVGLARIIDLRQQEAYAKGFASACGQFIIISEEAKAEIMRQHLGGDPETQEAPE